MQYSVPEGVKGTIFVIGDDAYAYNPSKDIRTEIPKPSKYFQPTFQCKLASDTFIVASLNPLKSPEGNSGFYKVVPFESSMIKIDKLGDRNWTAKHLDYNERIKLFLFYGRLYSDKIGLYMLDTAFDIIKDLSYVLDTFESPTSVHRFYILDSITILFNHTYQEVHKYSLIDSSSEIIAKGHLEAISHSKKMVALSVSSHEKIDLLVNIETGQIVKLPPIISAGFGFSPDDSFLACIHINRYLFDLLELHIYDIKADKMHKTKRTGGGDLVWVTKEI